MVAVSMMQHSSTDRAPDVDTDWWLGRCGFESRCCPIAERENSPQVRGRSRMAVSAYLLRKATSSADLMQPVARPSVVRRRSICSC